MCGGASAGCLGTGGSFAGTLTIRFVTPDTTTQSHTTSVTLVTCEGLRWPPDQRRLLRLAE
jgi:hypothetical protein